MATYRYYPKSYVLYQERSQRAALDSAARMAQRDHKKITDAIEEHGARMSDEGKGLLMGLAETLKALAAAARG